MSRDSWQCTTKQMYHPSAKEIYLREVVRILTIQIHTFFASYMLILANIKGTKEALYLDQTTTTIDAMSMFGTTDEQKQYRDVLGYYQKSRMVPLSISIQQRDNGCW